MLFQLDENQQSIQELVRDFAQERLAPRVEEIEKSDKFPNDLFREMVEMGIFSLKFPEKYGGGGLGHVNMSIALEEISKISGSAGAFACVVMLPMEAFELYGTEEQKQQYLVPALRGEGIGSFAFTEAGTGSDPKQLTTVAKKMGEKYVLNGVKRFISNAAYEGPIVLFAKEAENGECTAFIVNKFCKGYSISTPWEKVGFHGSHVYDVFLDDVEVSEADILGKPGKGFDVLLGTTTYGKLAFSAVFAGLMGGAYDLAVKYVKEKMHRDKSISKFPTVRSQIARIAANVESARLMLYKSSEDADLITDNMEKLQCSTALTKGYIADLATQTNIMSLNILGSYGVTQEYKVERFLRDSLIGPNIEGAAEIQRLIAGAYILNN